MVEKSLREWAENLEKRGDLVVIDKEVSTKFEIAAYIKKSCEVEGPAFRFTNVTGHETEVIGGFYGTKARILESVGVETHEQGVAKYVDATNNLIEPELVSKAPVKEVIKTGEDVDLYEIPLVHHSKMDLGDYITGASLIANLPHSGVRGSGIHRMYRQSKQELTIWAPPERRIGYAYRVNQDKGEPTEVAVVIGPPPAVTMGSISNVPHFIDKLSVAGGLQGSAIELVKCATIDVDVPAHAEMVIEGIIRPEKLVEEAPFGEFPGTYGPKQMSPIVEITGIMHRSDAMYHTILTGFPPTENNLMNWLPRSATVRQDAERAVPSVKQAIVKCDPYSGGNGMYEAFVSIDKRLEGDPRNVIAAVLGGRCQAKYCVVVDSDIDLYDERQINWALNTRVQPHRDVMTFPAMTGAPLDPSGPPRQSEKMGIDATVPLDGDKFTFSRVTVPGTDEVEW